MTKTKRILLFAVMIAFTVVCLFATFTAAYAEETTAPEQVTEEPQDEPQIDDNEATEPPATEQTEETTEEPNEETDGTTDTAFDMAALVEKFTAYLKDKYGADYEAIYNGIIEQWGSIEAYLVQFGEEYIPEEFNAGWNDFLKIAGETSVIWAPVLTVIFLLLFIIFGKKIVKKVLEKVLAIFTQKIETEIKKKIENQNKELNKQSAAISAQMKALKTIMPTTEKGAAAVQELDEKEKELTQ